MRVLCIFILIILLNNSLQASEKSAIMVGTLVENYTRGVSIPVNIDQEELDCMTNAVYLEAGNQTEYGMALVAQVIINRAESDDKIFPSTICGVIKQKIKNTCMFSFWCIWDKSPIKENKEFRIAKIVARKALLGHFEHLPVNLFFKRCDVRSGFFNNLKLKYRYLEHCFYEV